MEIKFTVTKEERKTLVKAIGEIMSCTPEYRGAPSFAFAVGNYVIDRYGTLTYDERTNAADIQRLLSELTAQGFVHENVAVLVVPETDEHITTMSEESFSVGVLADGAIEVSIAGFTSTALDNLERLITGKAALIMKAIGADALLIERTATTLRFPWFPVSANEIESDAYSRLVHSLCEMAKKQKRVTMKDKTQDSDSSEKFAFRCFLLRLGFIGKEYAPARKVLLSKLSGNSSFKSGDHKSRGSSSGSTTADVQVGSEVTAHE